MAPLGVPLNTITSSTWLATAALVFGLSLSNASEAAEDLILPDFKTVPPAIKARILPVDAKKGYVVTQLKPEVYLITDGGYQSVFVTTGKGVILIDAPPSYAEKILQAVSETTREPIVELVYSHSHLDHISGAPVIMKQVPNLKILAEQGVADFLREKHDPRRPVPTATFKGQYILTLGSASIEMKHGQFLRLPGDVRPAAFVRLRCPGGWTPWVSG